ncbi:MAG: CehA/McbA family metallohydrolase, partial [Phycisphaerae bacterium]|nr:CehA/McbA family metallohydrolase [Phycisphaerae bacterium]
LRFDKPGAGCITVCDPESGVSARSNPIIVTESPPAERIYWGDLHSQTYFSDGLRSPEQLYSFARDEAFLDIFALADHAEGLTDRQWDYFVAVTNDYNDPGSFATLVGFEWTCHRYGHRNVYYPGESGPILRSSDPAQSELSCVYKVAREHGALVIPHHSANEIMGVNWQLGHDSEVERLVEIHSIWGNSERPGPAGNPFPIRFGDGEKAGQHVIDALALGRRFGFIGGGDIHDGRPGDELHNLQSEPEDYRLLRRQGIMAVRAKELTREAIFDALWNRQVYATTNCRIYLDLDVCGAPMGSCVEERGRRPIRVHAVSEVPILRIEIVRNGADWHSITSDQMEVVCEIEDTGAGGPAWYYARVTRSDGQMAWSSPVWVG